MNHTSNPSSTPYKRQEPKLPSSGVPFGHLPAFLPGSASLVEQLDRRIMIVLRDGRHLVGVMKSFDQFSNMVLEDTSERRILHLNKGGNSTCYFVDVHLGMYLVRGDSMVLLGEIAIDDNGEMSINHQGSSSRSDVLSVGEVQREEMEQYKMKQVTLEEFEKLQEENRKDIVQELTWEFDMDLVV
mmetsp:Transcript_4448/g.8554  ORF Transcript_4448/g.8554 Transcript_4448/m.8554 type:complete len:185 (+) Transcript_4448:58-612(+)